MNLMNSGPWELMIIMLVLFQFIYYIPAMIAMSKKIPDTLKIFIINLLVGWTLFVWVIILVWVLITNSRQAPENI